MKSTIRCYSSYKEKPNPGNINNLLMKTDKEDSITKCRKTPNQRVYKSINVLVENPENSLYRRSRGLAKYL